MMQELSPLKDLALPIMAPAELPDSFALERVVALPDHKVNDGYEIELSSPNGKLTLRAVAAQPEIGGKKARRIEFDTPFFGTCVVECSGKDVVSEWFSEMEAGYPAYQVEANGLSPEEVIEFVRSLDYVRLSN